LGAGKSGVEGADWALMQEVLLFAAKTIQATAGKDPVVSISKYFDR
jgi:hypothetical protein